MVLRVNLYGQRFYVPGESYVEKSPEDIFKSEMFGAMNDPQVRCISEDVFYSMNRRKRSKLNALVGGDEGGRLQREYSEKGALITFGGADSFMVRLKGRS